jgi:hypothetical protein
MIGMRAIRLSWLAILGLAIRLAAGADQPVAVVTELSPGTGDVRVRRTGEGDWTTAEPLLALRVGDQLRATATARAVIVFSGGGVQTVTAANSPMTVQAPSGRTGTQNFQALMSDVVRFLSGQRRDVTYEALSVRGGPAGPPRIVAPRDTRLFPGLPVFEWTGATSLRYRVRLTAPDAADLELPRVVGLRVEYPASAPPLQAGRHYTWILEAPGQPAQKAEFDVVSADEARRIESALAELRPEVLSAYPATTVVVMRAGLLVRERLYADARRELLAAIAANPEAPTLRELLGQVYERTGLSDLAAQAYAEATTLSRPGS